MSFGWKTLGFLLYIAVYFVYLDAYHVWPEASPATAILKALPIVHLVFAVVSAASESTASEADGGPSGEYRKWVCLGLVSSAVGDVLLVWRDDFFQMGAVAFGLAHVFYVKAFGLTPFGSKPLFASFLVLMVAMYSAVTSEMPTGDLSMRATFVVYASLIFTMAWRSVAHYQTRRNFASFVKCFGAVVFIVSDAMVIWDKEKGSFHLAPFWIMSTYYLAQLCIAISAM